MSRRSETTPRGSSKAARPPLRSQAWFDNPANADMTARYVECTMNCGLSLDELQSGKPMIGIAHSGSDIAPCRHRQEAAYLTGRRVNLRVPADERAERRAALEAAGGYAVPPSQTPWQEIQRGLVAELADGMVLKPAVGYQRIDATFGVPRDNH